MNMKTKFTLFTILLISSFGLQAQTIMSIHQNNGTVLQIPLNTIDSITYTIPNPGNLATISTLPIGNITSTSATSGGNITNNVYLVKDATIAPGGALVPIGGDQKMVLEAGDYLQVNTSIASSVDVIVSVLEIT